jgi:hypothetical protein
MRLARILVAYLVLIAIVCGTLIAGTMWLIAPGTAVSQQTLIPPIPPRIADSIERRKPLEVREPEPVRPTMREANVSLTPAPMRSYKIRELTPPPKRKHQPREEKRARQVSPPASVAPVVSTARSDVPY